MLKSARSILAIGVVASCVECGGSALEAPRSPEPGGGAHSELESLERELDLDEQRLLGSLRQREAHAMQPPPAEPPASGGAAPGQAPSGAAPAPPSAAPAPAAESAAEPTSADREGQAAAPPATPCDVACRSFASMRRSAQRICELTGDSTERCARARQRVERAETQLGSAGCACRNEN